MADPDRHRRRRRIGRALVLEEQDQGARRLTGSTGAGTARSLHDKRFIVTSPME